MRFAEAAEAVGLLAVRDFLELVRVIFFLGDISEVYHHVRKVNNAPSHRQEIELGSWPTVMSARQAPNSWDRPQSFLAGE